ncbi:hypothetical protein [Chromobacterium haemolyticum]|uniref:hypothetical protein n=1 Tax=Chromobacterium haemolyticum TaxID=394935 RepID=UPI00117878CB|nr:hypothetical protein [Chromobacterium haemolyticum]
MEEKVKSPVRISAAFSFDSRNMYEAVVAELLEAWAEKTGSNPSAIGKMLILDWVKHNAPQVKAKFEAAEKETENA